MPSSTLSSLPSRRTGMLAAGAVALTVVLWACAFPAIRAALTAFSPGELAALRFGLASVVLAAYVTVFRSRAPALRDLPRIVFAGAFGIAGYNLLLNSGELTVDAGTAAFIVNMAPIFTAILGRIFLREHLRPWAWVGFAVSFSGIALIASTLGTLRFSSGTLLVLGAAVCMATQFVLQKPLMVRYGALPVTAWLIWVGTILLLPFVPSALVAISNASPIALGSLIFLGIGPAAAAYVAWSYALSRMPVSRAVSFLYLVPPISTVISVLWLNEAPALGAMLGGAIALAGVVIVNTIGRAPVQASAAPLQKA
jgi:drug/metabolite transporter (DMT)-like permease